MYGVYGGLLAWLLSRKYRRLTRRNLTLAFGDEKSERESAENASASVFAGANSGTLCRVRFSEGLGHTVFVA